VVHRNERPLVVNAPLLLDRHVLCFVIQAMLEKCCCVIVMIVDTCQGR
jgi:hypothetical protein